MDVPLTEAELKAIYHRLGYGSTEPAVWIGRKGTGLSARAFNALFNKLTEALRTFPD
jgi:hypothetical protein